MCVTSLQAILHSSTQHLCGFRVRPRSFIGCHQVFLFLRMGSCVLIILTSGMWYCNCRLVLDEMDLRIKAQSSLFYLENHKWFPFKFREPAVFLQFSYKMQFFESSNFTFEENSNFLQALCTSSPKKTRKYAARSLVVLSRSLDAAGKKAATEEKDNH